MNLSVLQREDRKEDMRWLASPHIIFWILQKQYQLKRNLNEILVPMVKYKNDAMIGEEYHSKKKEVENKAKKKVKYASKSATKSDLSSSQLLEWLSLPGSLEGARVVDR